VNTGVVRQSGFFEIELEKENWNGDVEWKWIVENSLLQRTENPFKVLLFEDFGVVDMNVSVDSIVDEVRDNAIHKILLIPGEA
jgi:hypothetical protein